MGIGKLFGGVVKEGLGRVMDGLEGEISYRVKKSLRDLERRIVRKVVGIMVIFSAFIFLALALAFFLSDYLGLGRAISFGFIGIILLLIGVIINLNR